MSGGGGRTSSEIVTVPILSIESPHSCLSSQWVPFIDQRKDGSAELLEQRNLGTSLKIWENTQSEPVFPPQQTLQLSRTDKEGQSESERSEG